jgi:hypothetical protein
MIAPKSTASACESRRARSGWFTYFRVYGPEADAFDGTWQLPDFEPAS